LIQQELDALRERLNNHVVRHNKDKKLPSGVSPNVAFALHEEYGGTWCLQPVDREVIRGLKAALGGEDTIRFVSIEYATRAQSVYDSLGVASLTLQNVWEIFRGMLPHM
jgi:hypothetical protein